MLEIRLHGNYVYTTNVDSPMDAILDSCYTMQYAIEENFVQEDDNPRFNPEAPKTTPVFYRYNLLMYPYPGFHELYHWIRDFFRSLESDSSPYYIGCWLNVFEYGQFVEWHSHWPKEIGSWHGFLCVDCEPSKTTYRLPDDSELDIESKNGQLVISRSAGDVHRTWPWEDKSKPRVTIAFDILPAGKIVPLQWLNHWIPI